MSLPFQLSPPLAAPLQMTPHGNFGAVRPLRNGIHYGVDLVASAGDPVLSATLGKVARTGFDKPVKEGGGGGGNYVIVSTGEYELGYMHLASIDVKPGDQVQAGDQVGTAGATGTQDGGVHLHFQVVILVNGNKTYVNPTSDLGLTAPSGGGGGAGGLIAGGAILAAAWLLLSEA